MVKHHYFLLQTVDRRQILPGVSYM